MHRTTMSADTVRRAAKLLERLEAAERLARYLSQQHDDIVRLRLAATDADDDEDGSLWCAMVVDADLGIKLLQIVKGEISAELREAGVAIDRQQMIPPG